VVQLLLTVFHFHVSWYSRRNRCWDFAGWYCMAIKNFILRGVIPVWSIIIAFVAMFNMRKGTNSYNLLLMSHALTSFFSTIHFAFYFKH